jgi:DNA-binding transcriptional LysR family regulator
MQDNIQPIVTVGHGPYADPSLISALLSVHLPLYPNLRLRMESMFPHELIHSVLSTELDLAIVDDPIENPLLTQVSLTAAPLHAVMASDDPAGKERAVALEDFGGVGWVMFQKRVHPALYDRVLEAASSSGITPAELHHYMSPQEVVQLIRENFGIALMPQGSAKELPRSEIIVRPLRSRVFLITSHLILRADQSSRLVNEFGRAFLKLAIPNATQAEASGQMLLKLQH